MPSVIGTSTIVSDVPLPEVCALTSLRHLTVRVYRGFCLISPPLSPIGTFVNRQP